MLSLLVGAFFLYLKSTFILIMQHWKLIVKGKDVDQQFRCFHYHSAVDIVAIKFKCCNTYYACYFCHKEIADHETQVWDKEEFMTKAIACGNCSNEMTIAAYLSSGNNCPNCEALFNPKCINHYHFYFFI